MKSRYWLAGIIGLYCVLAVLYTVATPLYESSDELWHYPMVRYMATHGLQLPPQDPQNPGPWRQEGSQPPLYYMFGAILTSWIDTSDIDQVRRINPHSDIGIVPPDGNTNMMTHSTPLNPLMGTALATYLVRFFSIGLGALTIFVTYLTALELLPNYPEVALGASALNAFLPMFLFISASVNNDNLSNLLGNTLVLLLIRLVHRTERPTLKHYLLIGVVVGAGILSKLNIGFLIPIVALVYGVLSLRFRDWRPLLVGGFISGTLTIVIAGWWYWHNYQLYGDPTGLSRFLEMVGKRPVPADLATIWAERDSFTQAFWGFFGGMNIPMSPNLYLGLNVFAVMGIIGACLFLIIHGVKRKAFPKWLGMGISLLWIAISLVSYARWTSETIASQGRLIFGALSVITLWIVWGWVWFVPSRLRKIGIGIGGVALLAVALAQPFVTLTPAYTFTATLNDVATETVFTEPQGVGAIGMGNLQIITEQVRPLEYVELSVDLVVETPLSANWSIFVHLVDEAGVIIAQRDVYPAQGLWATQDLAQGTAWRNRLAVLVPKNAYAPLTLDVMIGWYNLQTGERLLLPSGESVLRVGQVQLLSRPSPEGLPNPLDTQFGGLIELAGYKMTDISPEVGTSVELTLFWRALAPIPNDYVVFANIIDPKTLTKYASSNAMPVNWTRPTGTWAVGELIEDTHVLQIVDDAPEGIFELELGLYIQDAQGKFLRLPVVGSNDDFIRLTRIRILRDQS